MSIKHAILELLRNGPHHGYDLKASFEETFAPHGELNFGQVYTALERLERDGCVTHERVDQPTRPARKVFSITGGGTSELDRWLGSRSKIDLGLRNETFFKLVVASRRSPEIALAVLERERRAFFERLREVRRALDETRDRAGRMLLELAALKLDATLKWLAKCEPWLAQE